MSVEVGQVVGERYRVSEVLGRGSFGITYAADDLQTNTRVGANGYGVASFRFGDVARVAKRLAAPDLARLQRAEQLLRERDS